MGELNKDILRWVLLIGAAPIWWPFIRILWRDFNAALRDEGGLFGRAPVGRELERIQREQAAAPPTLTHEPWVRREDRRVPRMRTPARRAGPAQASRVEKGRIGARRAARAFAGLSAPPGGGAVGRNLMRFHWASAPLVLLACACHTGRDTRSSVDPRSTAPTIRLELGFDRSQLAAPLTGVRGLSGQWAVVEDEGAPSKRNVLEAVGPDEKEPFNLALLDDVRAAEVDLSVKLKAVGGEDDQGGGLVWRAKDAKNYYLARWNPLERNVRLYEVIDGERRQLATETVRVEPGWHELRITAKGEQMRCYLDGRAYLAAKDASFLEPGKVGLWTKGDAHTRFDDLKIQSGKR
ncbi:MAG: hypothetical protein IPJ77_16200 [Planctomycetes bacterium]|nr:hypothetical protein [Planctomycetota bacterium]